jgi:hypothetical protein
MSEETFNLEQALIDDLSKELSFADPLFNVALLELKIRNAIREVKQCRRYPTYYTTDRISNDLSNYYSNIRDIALYDYNMIGLEGQESDSEDGIKKTFINRKSLFNGIIPIARF